VLGQELQCYRKNRQIIYLFINARVVYDDAGKPLFYRSFATDITELRKYRQHLEELIKTYVRTHDRQRARRGSQSGEERVLLT